MPPAPAVPQVSSLRSVVLTWPARRRALRTPSHGTLPTLDLSVRALGPDYPDAVFDLEVWARCSHVGTPPPLPRDQILRIEAALVHLEQQPHLLLKPRARKTTGLGQGKGNHYQPDVPFASEADRVEMRAFRQRREALGLSQKGFARYAGLTQPTIADIETGTRPTITYAVRQIRATLARLESEGFCETCNPRRRPHRRAAKTLGHLTLCAVSPPPPPETPKPQAP